MSDCPDCGKYLAPTASKCKCGFKFTAASVNKIISEKPKCTAPACFDVAHQYDKENHKWYCCKHADEFGIIKNWRDWIVNYMIKNKCKGSEAMDAYKLAGRPYG